MNQPLKPPAATWKILIVDDHVLFREGLVSLFQSTPDFTIVGDVGSVRESIEMAALHQPDIVLMDFSLPDGTGLDATRAILKHAPHCQIVFLTIYETDENLLAAMQIGARGYLLKSINGASLVASLRALKDGEMAMSRKMLSRVVESAVGRRLLPVDADPFEALSLREIEVLSELPSGISNKEIARKLMIAENTVKHHLRSILDKLGAENRAQAASIARRKGLISRVDPRSSHN